MASSTISTLKEQITNGELSLHDIHAVLPKMSMAAWKKMRGFPDPPARGVTQRSEDKTPIQVAVKETTSSLLDNESTKQSTVEKTTSSLLDNEPTNQPTVNKDISLMSLDNTPCVTEQDTQAIQEPEEEEDDEEVDEDHGSVFGEEEENDEEVEEDHDSLFGDDELEAAFGQEEENVKEKDIEMEDVEEEEEEAEEEEEEEEEEEDEEEFERKEDERRRLAEEAQLQRLFEEAKARAEESASRWPEGEFDPCDYASSDIDEGSVPMDIEEEEHSNIIVPGSAEEAAWDAEFLGITRNEPQQSPQEPVASIELSDEESSHSFLSQTSITTPEVDSQSSTPSKKRKRSTKTATESESSTPNKKRKSTTTGTESQLSTPSKKRKSPTTETESQSSTPSKKRKSSTPSNQTVSPMHNDTQFDPDPLKRGRKDIVFDYDSNTCEVRTKNARLHRQLEIQKRDADAKYDELMAKLAAAEKERDELKQQVNGEYMARENAILKEQLVAMKMAKDQHERIGMDAVGLQLRAQAETARIMEERNQLIKERDEAYRNRDAWMKSYEKQKALKEKLKKALETNNKKQQPQQQQQPAFIQQPQPAFMQQTQFMSQPLGIMAQRHQQQQMAMPTLTPEQQRQIDNAAILTPEQQQDLDMQLDGIDLAGLPEDFFLPPLVFDGDSFAEGFLKSHGL